jgi:hypothetical protein
MADKIHFASPKLWPNLSLPDGHSDAFGIFCYSKHCRILTTRGDIVVFA